MIAASHSSVHSAVAEFWADYRGAPMPETRSWRFRESNLAVGETAEAVTDGRVDTEATVCEVAGEFDPEVSQAAAMREALAAAKAEVEAERLLVAQPKPAAKPKLAATAASGHAASVAKRKGRPNQPKSRASRSRRPRRRRMNGNSRLCRSRRSRWISTRTPPIACGCFVG